MQTIAEALRADRTVLGTFVKIPALESIDLVVDAGFDFVVVDLEHAQLDERAASGLVRHAYALGFPAVVRIASLDGAVINRLLEAGAAGVQLSTVRSAATAVALRDACHYPPAGRRSVSLAHPVARYGSRRLGDYLTEEAAGGPLVIGQFETARSDSPIAEIVRPLDVAFIGTTDLSVDLGVPGLLTDPAVTARVSEVAAAALAGGVVLGAFAATMPAVTQIKAWGARYIVYGSELQLLGETLRQTAASLRTMLRA